MPSAIRSRYEYVNGARAAVGVSTDGGDGRGLSCGSSSISRATCRAVPSLHQEMSGTIRCSAINRFYLVHLVSCYTFGLFVLCMTSRFSGSRGSGPQCCSSRRDSCVGLITRLRDAWSQITVERDAKGFRLPFQFG